MRYVYASWVKEIKKREKEREKEDDRVKESVVQDTLKHQTWRTCKMMIIHHVFVLKELSEIQVSEEDPSDDGYVMTKTESNDGGSFGYIWPPKKKRNRSKNHSKRWRENRNQIIRHENVFCVLSSTIRGDVTGIKHHSQGISSGLRWSSSWSCLHHHLF